MANGQQISHENVEKVRQWIAEREAAGDYVDYERNGKINRGSLCSELDFARSVVNQNPVVKELLQKAEARWYINPQKDDEKALRAASERSERKSELTSSENARLKDEVARLKAENSLLKSQLKKYSAMSEVLAETGIAPR